jgi:hypothetical protein
MPNAEPLCDAAVGLQRKKFTLFAATYTWTVIRASDVVGALAKFHRIVSVVIVPGAEAVMTAAQDVAETVPDASVDLPLATVAVKGPIELHNCPIEQDGG